MHQWAMRFIDEVVKACRLFGNSAVMQDAELVEDFNSLSEQYQALSQAEKIQVARDLNAQPLTFLPFCGILCRLEVVAAPEDFQEILNNSHEEVSEYFIPPQNGIIIPVRRI